MVIDRQLQQ